MASQQSLLDKPRNSLSKTFWLILFSCYHKLLSPYCFLYLQSHLLLQPHLIPHVCEHALDTKSCLAHVSEVAQGPILATTKDQKLNLLISLLTKSTPHIQNAMDTVKAIKHRINNPKEEVALHDCEQLMDLSIDRVWDSVVALTKNTIDSQQDAHSWLSSVLTNHATCLDGLEGPSRALMEAELEDLISRARTSLAMLVAVLPPKGEQFIDESLNGDFPSWVTSKDRRLLESSVRDIKANVVVAKDGSGKFKTVAEAIASAPDSGKTRYVIYVKKGTYKENVEIGKKKTNVMLVGDGMDATVITGSLNVIDGSTTFNSATVGRCGRWIYSTRHLVSKTQQAHRNTSSGSSFGADQSVINRSRCFPEVPAGGLRKPMSNQKNMVTHGPRTEDPNQNTGTSIQQCNLTPSSDLQEPVVGSIKTFLGRPWKKYSRTVVMQSSLDSHIDPQDGQNGMPPVRTFCKRLYYG
ncbi:Pectinesterase, catalytic [Sesbania bispinosa]|nr:Pectinesterase, catalytic [Sesbania bispinosa]